MNNAEMLPMVHLGWYNSFLALRPLLKQFRDLARDKSVTDATFCGHSQGGAVAVFCFLHFLESCEDELDKFVAQKKTVKLVTIGQPRVGDEAFVNRIQKVSKPLLRAGLLSINRMINSGDACPCYPPIAMDYLHFGAPICFLLESEAGLDSIKVQFGDKFSDSELDEVLAKAVAAGLKVGAERKNELAREAMDGGEVHTIGFSADALFSHM